MDSTLVIVLFLGILAIVVWNLRSARLGRPPGPRGYPFVGNALQIPKVNQWVRFEEWCKRYGDIVYINLIGTPTLILGSLEVANDLLESRGSIYSDRPGAVMAGELVGWNRGLGYCQGPPSSRFRSFRRAFHTFIGPRAVSDPNIKQALARSSLKLTRSILQWGQESPVDLAGIVREATASLILRLSYGYDVDSQPVKDPLQLVQIAEDAMHGFARASEPGAFWVDSFPLLKYLPTWTPGAGFLREAQEMRVDLERLYDVPHEFVKRSMASGTFKQSFVSSYLEQLTLSRPEPDPDSKQARDLETNLTHEELGQGEEFIKAAAASLYSGGEETTPSSIMSFILAMTLFPEVMARAQEELDNVVGSRAPSFDDLPSLPYIRAIVTEVWRWGVSVPLGLPHVLTQDDTYRGYHIPKGSVVWANIWSMMRNEAMFPEPEMFKPERYLGYDDGAIKATEAVRSAFGFGRRICPGLHLAEQSLHITVATMVFYLSFSKATDGDGNIIEPVVQYDGFISHPRPFHCKIEARFPRSVEALDEALSASDGS